MLLSPSKNSPDSLFKDVLSDSREAAFCRVSLYEGGIAEIVSPMEVEWTTVRCLAHGTLHLYWERTCL